MCDTRECIAALKESLPYIQQEYGVTGLRLIGSVARGSNRQDSDVDLLVDMPPKLFLISGLKLYLESILKTSVDLVRRQAHMSESFLKSISQDAVVIL